MTIGEFLTSFGASIWDCPLEDAVAVTVLAGFIGIIAYGVYEVIKKIRKEN